MTSNTVATPQRATTGLDSDMERLPFHWRTRQHPTFGVHAARHGRGPDDPPRPTANDDEEVEQDLGVPRWLDARRERIGIARLFSQIRQPAPEPPGERIGPAHGPVGQGEPFDQRVAARDVRQLVNEDGVRRRRRPITPVSRQHHGGPPDGSCHRDIEVVRLEEAHGAIESKIEACRASRWMTSASAIGRPFHSMRSAASHPRPARPASNATPRK